MFGYIYLLKIIFLDKNIKPLYKINTKKTLKIILNIRSEYI